FIAALQQLPVRQRAVLILRDVLGLSGAETAAALGTTAASIYSALQRAHRTLDQRRLDRSQQATMRALGDTALAEIVDAYVDAGERRDIDAVVAMLTEDAVLEMPPFPAWFRGRADVAAFLAARPLAPGARWRCRAVPARPAARARRALAARPDPGERAGDVRALQVGPGAGRLSRAQHQRGHA